MLPEKNENSKLHEFTKKEKEKKSEQQNEHTRANKEGIMNKTKYINQKNT